ncbi:RagB/SusD family nutrient uptake outer membrane protein, partial [Flavobacterium sp.]|uniref:RagB/SusD family nutrient uptake outer membrane protein n=1 Tax=Flavobacterium sp. TaxID=239 RepID=UPI003BE363AE
GGLGMGNPLSNLFAPTNTGSAVINGDGKGYNTPTSELLNQFTASATVIDKRRAFNIGEYATFSKKTIATTTNSKTLVLDSYVNIKVGQFVSGLGIIGSTNKVKKFNISTTTQEILSLELANNVTLPVNATLSFYTSVYPNKYISPTVLAFDAENDVPVLRYSDVLLMKAEADGNTSSSKDLINLVRARAGLANIVSFANQDAFEKALSLERKLEFAFENQRWFDLLRFNTTFQTTANKAEAVMDTHFANLYATIYSSFSVLPVSLAELQANANQDRFLLPIPQYEIDTNSFITIQQNPSY